MSKVIKKWIVDNKVVHHHYAALVGFEVAIRAHGDGHLAEAYDEMNIHALGEMFTFVTGLLDAEAAACRR